MDFVAWFFYPWATTVVRIVLAAVFLRSALPKLRQPRRFVSAVAVYHLLPKPWVRPFAYTLPWLELATGLLLLLGWHTRPAALASGALLLLFLSATSINLARGRADLDCGCSGPHHRQKIGLPGLARNVVLLLFVLLVALRGGGFLALDSQSPAGRGLVVETTLFGAALPWLESWKRCINAWTGSKSTCGG